MWVPVGRRLEGPYPVCRQRKRGRSDDRSMRSVGPSIAHIGVSKLDAADTSPTVVAGGRSGGTRTLRSSRWEGFGHRREQCVHLISTRNRLRLGEARLGWVARPRDRRVPRSRELAFSRRVRHQGAQPDRRATVLPAGADRGFARAVPQRGRLAATRARARDRHRAGDRAADHPAVLLRRLRPLPAAGRRRATADGQWGSVAARLLRCRDRTPRERPPGAGRCAVGADVSLRPSVRARGRRAGEVAPGPATAHEHDGRATGRRPRRHDFHRRLPTRGRSDTGRRGAEPRPAHDGRTPSGRPSPHRAGRRRARRRRARHPDHRHPGPGHDERATGRRHRRPRRRTRGHRHHPDVRVDPDPDPDPTPTRPRPRPPRPRPRPRRRALRRHHDRATRDRRRSSYRLRRRSRDREGGKQRNCSPSG